VLRKTKKGDEEKTKYVNKQKKKKSLEMKTH